MAIAHLQSNVTIRSGGYRSGRVRGAYRIRYWALTTLQKLRMRRRPALAESRPRGPHDPREAVNRPIPENLLNRVRSLTVAAPGARKNRGGKVGAEQWRTRR